MAKIAEYGSELDQFVPPDIRVTNYPFPLAMVGEYRMLLNQEMAHKIYSEAYDRGHYAGEAEVLLYARSICEFLLTLPIQVTSPKDFKLLILDADKELCLIKVEDENKVKTGWHELADGHFVGVEFAS